MTSIILASKSKTRLSLLTASGLDVEAIDSQVDESLIKNKCRMMNVKIKTIALMLAAEKAKKVSEMMGKKHSVIIASDQILECEKKIFDKPIDLFEAKKRIEFLQNKTHHLWTAIVLYKNEKIIWKYISKSSLKMRKLDKKFIESWVNKQGDKVLSSVGGYQIENEGIQLFDKIQGDYFSILGLPLLPLLREIRKNIEIEQ